MGKATLNKMILNEIDMNKDDKKFIEELIKLTGYSNLQNFKRKLNDEDADVEKLDGFIKVVKFLFPNEYSSLLFEYAKELNPDRITARLFLEYATLHHLQDFKVMMLAMLKESNKAETKDFLHVYETDHLIAKGELPPFEGVALLNSRRYSKPEARAYSKIAQIYTYYDMRNIYMLNMILEGIDEDIKQIKNSFLRNCYEGRVFRIKVDINFHNGKIAQLLESGFQIENAQDPTKSAVYLQIGNSYMFKSYDKAIKYYEMALEFSNSRTHNEIIKSINFVSLLWEKPENYIGDNTLTNELFYYIRTGNKTMAKNTLNKIDFDSLTPSQKGFNFFYQGLLFENEDLFYESIACFNEAGEKFYKQLPALELAKLGVKPVAIKALIA